MSIKQYLIREFGGIDQSTEQSAIAEGDSPDACNMDTRDGNLAVAKGFEKQLSVPVPGSGPVRRLYLWRWLVSTRYVVIAGAGEVTHFTAAGCVGTQLTLTEDISAAAEAALLDQPVLVGEESCRVTAVDRDSRVLTLAQLPEQTVSAGTQVRAGGCMRIYAWTDTQPDPDWEVIYTYPATVVGQRWDIREAKIGTTDHLLIACGEHGIVKWDGVNPASLFGTQEAGSREPVNFLAMHYGRLFAAGDPQAPSRLYWSQAPGGSRSIEQWTADAADTDTGGGHVEVGDSAGDPITGLVALSNQLLIFKRSSVYRLLGDRPGNYRVYQVSMEPVQTEHTTCALYQDVPYWLTRNGVYYHDGQNSRRMYNARCISRFLAGARLDLCKAVQCGDELYFTAHEGDDARDQPRSWEYDNAMVVYDLNRRTYMIRRGFGIGDVCACGGSVYLINERRYVYRFGVGSTYDGQAIAAYWCTPLTDLDNKCEIKGLQGLYLRGTGSGSGDAVLCIQARAGRNLQSYRMLMPDNETDVLEVPLFQEGRVLALKLENEAGSGWQVRGGLQLLYDARMRTI